MEIEKNEILTPRQRQQRNREEMINYILEAAQEVMRKEGVAALNLNEVAARVKVKTPSLYQYFPGKMAIYDALFRKGNLIFAERMEKAGQLTNIWEMVQARFEAYMQFSIDYPELYQLLFERPVPGFIPSEESMEVSRKSLARAGAELNKALEQGQWEPGLPLTQVRDLLIALMHGMTSQHLANEPHLPIGEGRYGSLIPAAIVLLRAAWNIKPGENK